ncbi:putative ATP-dependent RNA helicase TDRD12 [Battus philenor]|uniref:putative ATP-dependent RNA helicase TDRD12 n=1 Tax=Battus philenor TaxID=42288 RepID=UPI0035CF6C62
MFPDGYQVEVLYYLNPHLLWIEVIDPSVVSENNFVFEQIGLYSLLPLEPVLDVEEEKLKTRLSEKWLPAALTIIKKELAGAQEVWFSPTYIDRRSSIFDDNIHKYGELFLKKNNKFKSLSKTLVKSGFAIIDTCLFHQELSSGKLKTKLRSHECETVIKEIENYYRKKENPKQDWENSVRTHTAISQATQELESALTEGNLKKHNNCFAQQILQNKINDFELCKGFEEESVGRAYKTKHKTMQIEIAAKEIAISKHTAPNLKSTLLKKKLDLMTSKRSRFENFSKSEKQILKETKEFLEFNTVAKIDEKKHELQMSSLNNDLMSNECNDHCNDQRFNIWTKDIKEKKLEKSHKKDENPSKKIRVCYGPPGVAPTKLSLKVMIQNVTENPKVNKNLDRDIHDTYRNMDSDVEIEITNESALMSIQKDSYNNIKCAQSSKSPAVSREKKINIINKNSYSDVQCRNSNYNTEHKLISSRVLQKKLKLYESKLTKVLNSSLTHISSCSDTTNKDSSTSLEEIKLDQKDDKKIYRDSDDEDLNDIVQKINEEYSNSKLANVSTSCNSLQ